jgi:hypothetical protein
MLEKILLASILTFSFNICAQMNGTSPSQKVGNVPLANQNFITLTQHRK